MQVPGILDANFLSAFLTVDSTTAIFEAKENRYFTRGLGSLKQSFEI
jgi:hypothetical protein